MKNEIKNPLERFISKEEIYLFGDGGVSECDDCCDSETTTPGHTGRFICSHCGGEFDVSEQNYVDPENTYCEKCYDLIVNGIFQCYGCGSFYDVSDMNIGENGESYCNTCYRPSVSPDNTFICSKCKRSCPCSYESAEEGVCKNCYVPPKQDPDTPEPPKDDTTDTPFGGTTDVPADTEGTEPPKNEDQYGNGGTNFVCKLCKRTCSCNNRSKYDVCCYCAPNAFCCEACGEVKYKSDMYGSSGVCTSCRNTASLSIGGPDSINAGSSGGSYFATLSCSFDYVPDYEWSVQSNTGDFSITGAGVLTASAAGVATVTVREKKLGLIANKTVSSALVNMCPYCTNSVTAVNRYLDTDVCNECATNTPTWVGTTLNIVKGFEGTARIDFSKTAEMPWQLESSDENIAEASVELMGNRSAMVRIIPKNLGTATITARIELNGKTDTLTVNVIDDMVATPSATVIEVGETVTLSTQINDERYNCYVDYIVEGTNVLSVGNSNNEFVAIKPGNTKIKVRAYGGDNSYIERTIEVTVRGIEWMDNTQNSYEVKDGEEITIGFNTFGYEKTEVVCNYDADVFEVRRNTDNDFVIKAKYRITNIDDSVVRFGIPDVLNREQLMFEKTMRVSVVADVYIISGSGNGLPLTYLPTSPHVREFIKNEDNPSGSVLELVNIEQVVYEDAIRLWRFVPTNTPGEYILTHGNSCVNRNDTNYLFLSDNSDIRFAVASPNVQDTVCALVTTDGNKLQTDDCLDDEYVKLVVDDAGNSGYDNWRIMSKNAGILRLGIDRFGSFSKYELSELDESCSFLARYLADYDRPPESSLNTLEVSYILESKRSIVSIFQHFQHDHIYGYDSYKYVGKRDALLAIKESLKLGQPDGTAIYFALEPEIVDKATEISDEVKTQGYMEGVYEIFDAFFNEQSYHRNFRIGFYGTIDTYKNLIARCPYMKNLLVFFALMGADPKSDHYNSSVYSMRQTYFIGTHEKYKNYIAVDPDISFLECDLGDWGYTEPLSSYDEELLSKVEATLELYPNTFPEQNN